MAGLIFRITNSALKRNLRNARVRGNLVSHEAMHCTWVEDCLRCNDDVVIQNSWSEKCWRQRKQRSSRLF